MHTVSVLRPPFTLIVTSVGADYEALVRGPHTDRTYRWHDVLAERAPTGHLATDARALATAIVADAGRGPWLVRTLRDRAGERVVDYARLQAGTTIGRATTAHLQIMLGTVARQHCRFDLDGGRWYVEDLGSTNGTYVRGERVVRAVLANNDAVSIAGNDVQFVDSLVRVPRAIDAADDAAWSSLFLDRLELAMVAADEPRYAAAAVAQPAAIRAGAVTWTRGASTISDARWLFADASEAEVFVDVLLGAEVGTDDAAEARASRLGGERDELGVLGVLDTVLVGDHSARFASSDTEVGIVRVDRVVARIAAPRGRTVPDLEPLLAAMVERATTT